MAIHKFRLVAEERDDCEDLKVEVIAGPHMHPGVYLSQTDFVDEDQKYTVLICVAHSQLAALRDIIDRTLSGELERDYGQV